MKKIIFLLLLVTMLLMITGCPLKTPPEPIKEEPKFPALIELSNTNVKIKHNSQNVEPIILTVKQAKELKEEINYNVELVSPNRELISFLNENGEETTGFSTRNFGHVDDTQKYDLHVFAKKCEGQYKAEYMLQVNLLNSTNNKTIGKEKVISIIVE